MKAQYIDYEETRSFSSAVIRYINGDASLEQFYNHPPTLEGFKNLLNSKKNSVNRAVLHDVLREQYHLAQPTTVVNANLELLRNENTYTITTGHQLNLFTGPLYFIYKIVTSIKLCQDLKQQFPDKNFIPVYWMATEDHDFEEINHTYVNGEKISWNKDASGATGRLDTSSISYTVKQYIGLLGFSENAQYLAKVIEKAYSLNHYADATRYLVNELFGKYGLIIIDGDHQSLKKQFSAIIEQEIIKRNSFKLITETNNELLKNRVNPQVNPREINFFYLLEDIRERLIFENERYYVINSDISFSEEEIKEEIRNFPERFSPNVVLRPLYQELILPNLAYIGGGAEIIYWLQLKSTFEHYKIDFPLLILRNSAMLSNQRITQKLNRLHFCYRDVFKSTETLTNQWINENTEHNLNVNDELREIDCVFQKLKLRAHKIDPSLAPSTEAIKIRLEKAMRNLEKKLLKAEKRNHAQSLENIINIKKSLFPGNTLQERKENFGLFYVKYGDDFIEELVKHFVPLDFKFTILS